MATRRSPGWRSQPTALATGPEVLVEAAHPAGRGHRGERGGRRRRARRDPRRAPRRQAGRAGQQGDAGDGRATSWRRRRCAGGGELVPVDSEHSAVLQCVAGRDGGDGPADPHRSGGPFRDWPPERVGARHGGARRSGIRPGAWASKITVDSATLANKALEVIEAHHLFGLSYDALEVVVHPQSIVHAFVEFCDGSVIAQLGLPLDGAADPVRADPPRAAARHRRAPLRSGGRGAAHVRAGAARTSSARSTPASRRGGPAGTAPAVFNAANEVAVAAFLDGAIPFGRISEIIERCWTRTRPGPPRAVEAVRDGRSLGAGARPASLLRSSC